MEVFRITLSAWSKKLLPSGVAGRWNSSGKKVIYTSGSRALAYLENLAHRSHKGSDAVFRLMILEIPATLGVEAVDHADLPPGWFEFTNYPLTQRIGDDWLNLCQTPLLKVPSAIVADEFNFLLNPEHADFKKIRIKRTEPFRLDPRIEPG